MLDTVSPALLGLPACRPSRPRAGRPGGGGSLRRRRALAAEARRQREHSPPVPVAGAAAASPPEQGGAGSGRGQPSPPASRRPLAMSLRALRDSAAGAASC